MNEVHIANLKQLAVYLRSGLKPGTEFDMNAFTYEDLPTECGSVGCAVGHGPYAGIPKSANESWAMYAYRAFGIHVDSDEWVWLFGSRWATIPEYYDHLSVAKRIHAFLDAGNKVPWTDEDDEIQAMLDAVFRKYEL